MPQPSIRLVYSKNGTNSARALKKSSRSPHDTSEKTIQQIVANLRELQKIRPVHVGGVAIIVRNLLRDAKARTTAWRVPSE